MAQVRVRRVPVPQIQGAGEALVRVSLAAICGSDLHVYAGREEGLQHGTTMGHEFVGHVVQVPPRLAQRVVPAGGRLKLSLRAARAGGAVLTGSTCPGGLPWVLAGREAAAC